MADFTITQPLLARLAARNNFLIPGDALVFFGIRGALPVDIAGTPFGPAYAMRLTDIDHVRMRCTLGQMRGDNGGLAVFPGSTVPSMANIIAARARRGVGANMLMLGRYSYDRGVHKIGRPGGHRAFRQAVFFPVWRTSDDLDYDLADAPDLDGDLVWDNLHCAYHDNLDTPGFSSAGCQVVCGHPKSPARQNKPETGPWKRFIENAYGGTQTRFTYMLFGGAEAAMVAGKPAEQIKQSVRFGSSGPLVEAVQTALIAKGYELGSADGDFGRDTIEALMAFQTREFGTGKADGIVGPNTAAALGIALPTLADAVVDTPLAEEPRPSIAIVETPPPLPPAPYAVTVAQQDRDWSARIDDGDGFYVGTTVQWSGFRGIYQPHAKLSEVPGGRYDPAAWEAALGAQGPWAWFLAPTIVAESGGLFGRVNTYDGAGLTFGALQFASHTPDDNLILLFRRLMARPEAERWFPDLALVNGQIHRRTASGTVSLEKVGANDRLTDFMAYLNPDATSVSPVEVANAARLIGWSVASDEVKEAQIRLGIERFKLRVNHLGSYGVNLAAHPVHRLIWIADIRHHGRGRYTAMRDALKSSDPDAALARIGGNDPRWADRVKTVRTEIGKVKAKLAGESWGSGAFA